MSLRILCAWCQHVIREGNAAEPVSHGLCPSCQERLQAEAAAHAIQNAQKRPETRYRPWLGLAFVAWLLVIPSANAQSSAVIARCEDRTRVQPNSPRREQNRNRLLDALVLGFAIGAGPNSGVAAGALRGLNLAREQEQWECAIASPSITPFERLLLQQQWRQWRELQESQRRHVPVHCSGTLIGDFFSWSCP